ncbi:NAD(P)-dependent oxidoreductase [Methylomonas rhizoryzae]|uniref:NAD(P)-dependent oxidoreductase n=1 Tax=Methylomonas rhizoryzae TaxID=2608981 RepID=UPI00123200A5
MNCRGKFNLSQIRANDLKTKGIAATLSTPSMHLINMARGDVVDSPALIDGRIAGAGLEVYENQPKLHPGFLSLENATLLPHLGSATIATRTAMDENVSVNLEAFFAGRELPDRVV